MFLSIVNKDSFFLLLSMNTSCFQCFWNMSFSLVCHQSFDFHISFGKCLFSPVLMDYCLNIERWEFVIFLGYENFIRFVVHEYFLILQRSFYFSLNFFPIIWYSSIYFCLHYLCQWSQITEDTYEIHILENTSCFYQYILWILVLFQVFITLNHFFYVCCEIWIQFNFPAYIYLDFPEHNLQKGLIFIHFFLNHAIFRAYLWLYAHESLWGLYGDLGIGSRLAICKTNVLLAVLSL